MTHVFGKEQLIQFTVRCFVNFCQVFAGIFWGVLRAASGV